MKLKRPSFGITVLNWISGFVLIISIVLLLATCHHCYPELEQDVYTVFAGMEESPVREAFHVLAEGLEAGEPVKETFHQTVQVLIGKKD